MKVAYRITGVGSEAAKRVTSITVSDEQGIKSDKVNITFDDRNYELNPPALGLVFDVYLGYDNRGPPLRKLGTFQVDEIKFSETEAASVSVSGSAMFTNDETMKAPTAHIYDEKTIGDIAGEIAGRHGYALEIDDEIASIYVDHLDQNEESDIHFITRIAEEQDAFVKIQDQKMIVRSRDKTEGVIIAIKAPINQSSSAEIVVMVPTSVSITQNARNKYKAVRAYWQDPDAARRKGEVVGSGDPEFKIRRTYVTKDAAINAATAKFKQLKRGTQSMDTFNAPGDPNIRSGMELLMIGFRDEVNGSWSVTSVTHTMNTSGYQISLRADRKP